MCRNDNRSSLSVGCILYIFHSEHVLVLKFLIHFRKIVFGDACLIQTYFKLRTPTSEPQEITWF